MFCSKCGRTIPTGESVCPVCGKAVGNAPLASSGFCSAQSIIAPGEGEFVSVDVNDYTSTAYTSMSETQRESGEVDSRTGYRPVYSGSAPDEVRNDMRTAMAESRERIARREAAARTEAERILSEEDLDLTSEEESPAANAPVAEDNVAEAAVTEEADSEEVRRKARPVMPLSDAARERINELGSDLEDTDDEVDMNQFKARPITAQGRAGISREVSEYIRKIEDNQTRRSRRKAAEPELDGEEELLDVEDIEDIKEEKPAPRRPRVSRIIPSKSAKPADEDADTDETSDEPLPEDITDEDIPTNDDDFDYDEEELEDDRPSTMGTIIKIVIALLVVGAVAFGVTRYIGYIKSNQSSAPIEGVTESLYNDALDLIDAHNTEEYKSRLISDYASNGVLAVSTTLAQDTAAINALLPAEPATNDATFLEAVNKIQDNIGSAILMDAMAAESGSDDSESESRWAIVNNSIAQLKSASSAAELTAIINGQTITVRNETPAPTATPVVYTSLQKGDENNEVLQLQVRLYTLGYLTGDRDGAFGSETQTAIKLFQKTAGLEQTGIADSETQTRLFADDAPYAPGATTPAPTVQVTNTPEPTDTPSETTEGMETT